MYEMFLKTHLIFALALATLLWYHIQQVPTLSLACLGIASAAWLLQHIIWLVRLIHRSSGGRSTPIVSVEKFNTSTPNSPEAMAMEIKYDKSWNLGPGQYIYVTLPRLSFHTLGLVQSHPYVITWNDGQHITILVERCKGFSNAIFALSDAITHSAIIDGPYGRVQSLGQYDKVLLLASGIGVAAHLLHIRQLLEAHEDKSVRVRRVAFTWFLESPGKLDCNLCNHKTETFSEQEKWAGRFLRRLQEIDNHNTDGRQIFVLKIYTTGVNEFQSKDSRYLRTSKILNLSAEIDGEAGVEGGNTAVSGKTM